MSCLPSSLDDPIIPGLAQLSALSFVRTVSPCERARHLIAKTETSWQYLVRYGDGCRCHRRKPSFGGTGDWSVGSDRWPPLSIGSRQGPDLCMCLCRTTHRASSSKTVSIGFHCNVGIHEYISYLRQSPSWGVQHTHMAS